MRPPSIDYNIDEIARKIVNLAKSTNLDLHGPADIELGFGWEPTLSFWYGERRIHIYWSASSKDNRLTIEVAEEDTVLLGKVRTYEELWDVFEMLLREAISQICLITVGNRVWQITTSLFRIHRAKQGLAMGTLPHSWNKLKFTVNLGNLTR